MKCHITSRLLWPSSTISLFSQAYSVYIESEHLGSARLYLILPHGRGSDTEGLVLLCMILAYVQTTDSEKEVEMKQKQAIPALVIAVLVSATSYGVIYFEDGGTHEIDYAINDDVLVDQTAPGTPTTVSMVAGGTINTLQGYDNSIINISGGSVYRFL